MKKLYNAPEMKVVMIKTEQMLLAGSSLTISNEPTSTVESRELDLEEFDGFSLY